MSISTTRLEVMTELGRNMDNFVAQYLNPIAVDSSLWLRPVVNEKRGLYLKKSQKKLSKRKNSDNATEIILKL